MRLTHLEGELLRITPLTDSFGFEAGVPLAEAQAVSFLCPLCYAKSGGPRGTHSVICYFVDRGVPPEIHPEVARWQTSGSGIDDLTLSPSVHLQGTCGWHGWVQNGDAS